MTLIEFLTARYGQEEDRLRSAYRVRHDCGPLSYSSLYPDRYVVGGREFTTAQFRDLFCEPNPDEAALADIASKRAILARHEHAAKSFAEYPNNGNGCALMALTDVLKSLAAPFADHPECQQEWSQ